MVPTSQAMQAWALRDSLMYYEGGEVFVEKVDSLLPEVESELLTRLENRLQSLS